MFDVTFWVGVAFFLFVALTIRPILGFSSKTLDKRSEKIRGELEEAIRLREEAQATLAAYQKRQREAHAEAEALLASARETVRQMEKDAAEKLRQAVEARTQAAHDRIAREETQALADLKKKIVGLATQAAQTSLQGDFSDEVHERLIRLAVKDASRLLH